jgi:hypothetical protein
MEIQMGQSKQTDIVDLSNQVSRGIVGAGTVQSLVHKFENSLTLEEARPGSPNPTPTQLLI